MSEFELNIPDKMPKEGYASDKQRLKILQMSPEFPRDELAELGKIQASSVLDQMIPAFEAAARKAYYIRLACKFGLVAVLAYMVVTCVFSGSSDDSPDEQSEQPGSLSMDEDAIDKVRDEMAKKRIAQHALDAQSNEKEGEIITKDPEVTTEPESDSTPDIPSEEPTIPEVRDIESLEGITLPVTLDVTVPFSLLNAAGKETSIPADTSILIVKRSPSGTLTMKIGGKLFVGNETRLSKKVRIAPN